MAVPNIQVAQNASTMKLFFDYIPGCRGYNLYYSTDSAMAGEVIVGAEIPNQPTREYSSPLLEYSFQRVGIGLTDTSAFYLRLKAVDSTGAETETGNIKPIISTYETIAGRVDSFSGLIESPVNKTYVLDVYATVSYALKSMILKTAAGTCTVSLKIDGVAVPGFTSLAVSTTELATTPSSYNVVYTGSTLSMMVESVVGVYDFQYTVGIVK